jgi:predicted sugar kinase
MSRGPLQVLVVNFEDSNFTGEIQAELVRLDDAGIVKVLDLLFVARSESGEVEVLKTSDVHSGQLSQAVLGLDDPRAANELGSDRADIVSVADSIDRGGAAAIAVLEHRWAIPLHDAIARAGGRQAAAEWIDESQLTGLGVTLP